MRYEAFEEMFHTMLTHEPSAALKAIKQQQLNHVQNLLDNGIHYNAADWAAAIADLETLNDWRLQAESEFVVARDLAQAYILRLRIRLYGHVAEVIAAPNGQEMHYYLLDRTHDLIGGKFNTLAQWVRHAFYEVNGEAEYDVDPWALVELMDVSGNVWRFDWQ